MTFEFARVLEDLHGVTEAVIEGAALWSGYYYGNNKKDMDKSLIATKQGHTFTLAYLIGSYMAFMLIHGIKVHIVNAQEWKGNLDKDETKEKVTRVCGKDFGSSHCTDAVAIGLYHLGHFSRKKR
jgi:hypothetical protein